MKQEDTQKIKDLQESLVKCIGNISKCEGVPIVFNVCKCLPLLKENMKYVADELEQQLMED